MRDGPHRGRLLRGLVLGTMTNQMGAEIGFLTLPPGWWISSSAMRKRIGPAMTSANHPANQSTKAAEDQGRTRARCSRVAAGVGARSESGS